MSVQKAINICALILAVLCAAASAEQSGAAGHQQGSSTPGTRQPCQQMPGMKMPCGPRQGAGKHKGVDHTQMAGMKTSGHEPTFI